MKKTPRESLTLHITCAPGLEALLRSEIESLGFAPEPGAGPGWRVRCAREGLWRLSLGLGLAQRIWIEAARFSARHFGQLERGAEAVPWAELLAPGRPVRVDVHTHKSRLFHGKAITERIGRALAACGLELYQGSAESVRSESALDAPSFSRVLVRIHRDECRVRVDTSGAALHRRGWKTRTAKAPLREDLARAVLLTAGWRPGRPLLDPMMGSGTFVLEAARWASGEPCGGLRRFAFMDTPGFDVSAFAKTLSGLRVESVPTRILGRDRDAGAVESAKANAVAAGLVESVAGLDLACASVGETAKRISEAEGSLDGLVVVANPPYGKRVGKNPTLVGLYRDLGRLSELAPGASVTVISAREDLLRATGADTSPQLETEHGGQHVHVWSNADPSSAAEPPSSR